MKLFAIKDMKAQTFFRPTVASSTAEALRTFEIVANEGDSMISRFPNDFRVFHIADFDVLTGVIQPLDHLADLGSAQDFKRRPSVPTPMFDTAQTS